MLDLKLNPNNPRQITKDEFEKLKQSIKKNPDFLKGLPIVYDEENIILSGNQRYTALKQLVSEGEITEVSDDWFVNTTGWSDTKKREFIVQMNTHSGDWDWDILGNQYDDLDLEGLGLDMPEIQQDGEEGWNPEKTYDDEVGDGINEKVGYGLQSFWKDISNKNAEAFKYQIDLPTQGLSNNVVRQKYSRTNLEEIQRIISTYMRKGDYFLESCCGWSTFGSSAKYFGYSGIGVDIWETVLDHSKKQIEAIKNDGVVEIKNMDAMNLEFEDNTFDYVYCNPPFMDQEKYSGLTNDIASKDFKDFGNKFVKLMEENRRVLKEGKLCTITINDMRKKGLLVPLQAYVIKWGEQAGFKLHDFVVAEVLSQKIRLRKKDYELRRTVKCHEYVITFIK